jgi:hypothetical protein
MNGMRTYVRYANTLAEAAEKGVEASNELERHDV